MKRSPILLLSILLSLASLSLLDYERALTLRVEEVVQRFHSPVKYRYIGDGVFEFTDTLSGYTFRKQVTDVKPQGGKQPKKIITIDVTQIDTTGFGTKFRKIKTIPAGHAYVVPVGFQARDGVLHFVAARFQSGSYVSTDFYKWENGKDTLDAVQSLSGEWLYPFAQGTFFKSNMPNFAIDSFGTVMVYDTPDGGNLPTRKRAVRYGKNETAQKPRAYDFDGDGVDEIVLRNAVSVVNPRVVVSKYHATSLKFFDPFDNDFGGKNPYGSWAVGDFDKDGKREFANVAYGGFVYFVENGGNDSTYSIVFTDTTRSVNAGFNYEGNDLDRDGGPEVFIGSSFFGGLANIAVYEMIADNDFEVSLWIEIRGVGALKEGIVTGDVDGDGRDELIVQLGGVVLVLSAIQDDEYEVILLKTFSSEIGVELFDIDDDGTKELLISQQRLEEPRGWFTEVYSLSKTIRVEPTDNSSYLSFNIIPNPMRYEGWVHLTSKSHSLVTLDMYSSTGAHVKTLFQGQFVGTQSIPILLRDVAPGIYFIQLKSTYQAITKKILVI